MLEKLKLTKKQAIILIGIITISTIATVYVLTKDDYLSFTFDHDGLEREYLLYLPNGLPDNAPLVFVLHGFSGNAIDMLKYSGMNDVADEEGFAVCYPQGWNTTDNFPHWNANLNYTTIDDVGFLSELALYLQSQYNLNPQKTFVSGHSNGGFMSYTLACEASDVFKGAASVAGSMSGYTWNHRNISQPIPILQITGLEDDIVPIDGTGGVYDLNMGWDGAPHMDEIIDYWKDLSSCTSSDTESISSNTDVVYYRNGINGNEVWYYNVDNYGPGWPSEDDEAGFSASEAIWEFFENI